MNSMQSTGKLLTIFLIPVLLAVATLLFAGTTGKIAGRVIDATTGEPLAGANVYIEKTNYGAAADLNGNFFIINLPPGVYSVTARMMGYQSVKATNVRVSVDLTTKQDFQLRTEALELGTEVVVVAERPLIQKDVTSTAKSVQSEEIKALPVENFNEIVNLQAGVIDGHFRGGRLGEVAYMVDGIPVNDRFNNSLGIEVENSSIQQLEVISGAFNAEYGQAMSGVVNIVTKKGSNKIEGDVSAYLGNYYTRHDQIFPNIDKIDGQAFNNLQVTLSGPVPFLQSLKFFATGRLFQDDGYIYGHRIYNITDNNPFFPTGDSAYVPMNDFQRYSFHGKLSLNLTRNILVDYAFMWEDNSNRYYDHGYRLVPDGIKKYYRDNRNHNLIFNHTLSNRTFHTLKFSGNYSHYKGYVFENMNDPRYTIPEQGLPQSDYTYRSGGNQNDRYRRHTTSNVAKWDLTSQLNVEHKIGTGLLLQQHQVYNYWTAFQSKTVGYDPNTRQDIFEKVYPEKYAPGYEEYTKKPLEFAAYVQDKMEYDDFIINVGLRFDYFDPRTNMLADTRNPEFNTLFPFGNVKTKAKMQASPRLGVAFPISDKGVIHVSYGHFFQIPVLEQLYLGIIEYPDGTTRYLINKAALNTVVGNPDLDAQRTTNYEIGLKQVLYGDLALEFTAYYRDIRNLVDTEIIETYDKNKYARYINRDYGNTRGVIVSLEKRFSQFWGGRLDYTYQHSEGNSSDPRSVFFDNQTDPPRESEKKLIPLDWDQRSTLNFAINFGKPGNWNVGLIGQIGSGTPYTADVRWTGINVNFRNNRIKPSVTTFDLKAEKVINIANTRVTTFLLVYNLLDRMNEYGVYSSTGRANKDLNTQFAGDVIGLHTIEEYINNPGMYSAPRQIRLGMSFGF